MRCIFCDTPLGSSDFCRNCGADISLLKRIERISNLLYNRGLEKASVRDLSGAIGCLQRSLKFNKENTDARNLLGLCYYEIGEVVSALCEWVISKNLKQEDNLAEYFLNKLQNDRNQLDTINQSIRKYNQSIEYCHQDHEDMAVMQLKKVVAKNPKLVKAQQLLALLYMKRQEYERARRLLRKAAAIDNTDTTTLRYLTEIEEITGRSSAFGGRRHRDDELEEEQQGGSLRYISGNETIIQPTTFRDSSTIATFINIGLGILLGGAIIWFMAIPASRQRVQEEANRQVTDAQMKLATGNSQLQDLQTTIDGYQAQVDAAELERDEAVARADSYEGILEAANLFITGEQDGAIAALEHMEEDDLDGPALTLYKSLMVNVSDTLFRQYYTAGTTAYVNQDYTTAAKQLQLAVDADPDNVQSDHYNAMLYLGFAYYNSKNYTKSDKVFRQMIEMYPSQAANVRPYLTGTADADESTQGEVSMHQDDPGNITVIYGGDENQNDQQQTETNAPIGYDPADVAWTDPYTGLHYDAYGNLLDQVDNSGTGSYTDNSYTNNNYTDTGSSYDTSLIAWTDPNTGLHYDAYGNLLDGGSSGSTGGGASYDTSQVAWTDPYTGLHYDAYGNLLG